MKKKYESKTIVLKKTLTDDDAYVLIREKKTDLFRSMLRKPKSEDVHVDSTILNYECISSISGKYTANYFRKTIHTISVAKNVNEIVFGNGIFPIRSKSDFHKKISSKLSKNKVDLPLEEHVYIESEGEFYFDHDGNDIKFPYKVNSKTIENYPLKILEKNESRLKKTDLSDTVLIHKLTSKLKKPLESDVRDVHDETIVREISEIYVPVYEARLIGPKKSVKIMRIDAVRNKIL